MGYFQNFARRHFVKRHSARSLPQLANEVAVRCHEAVWRQVAERARGMRMAEARGYVKARAALIVDAEVDRVLALQPDWDMSLRPELTAQASDKLVGMIARDLVNLPSAFRAQPKRAA